MSFIEQFISWIKKIFNIKSSSQNNEEQVKTESVTETNSSDIIVSNSDSNDSNEQNKQQDMIEEITPIEEYKKQFNRLIVVLDPGHAVTTSGKKSPYSLKMVDTPKLPFEEWKFNREICDRLSVMLRERGVEVFYTTDSTRDGNTDLGLSKRAERANSYAKNSTKKCIYISVHSNAHVSGTEWTSANGWSAYTTKGQNRSDVLAECLYDYAEKLLKDKGLNIRKDKSDNDRDWEENFTVLVKANMPAVLTENLFYTNIKDTEFLNSEEGMNTIALIHFYGILEFAEKEYNM